MKCVRCLGIVGEILRNRFLAVAAMAFLISLNKFKKINIFNEECSKAKHMVVKLIRELLSGKNTREYPLYYHCRCLYSDRVSDFTTRTKIICRFFAGMMKYLTTFHKRFASTKIRLPMDS